MHYALVELPVRTLLWTLAGHALYFTYTGLSQFVSYMAA